MNRHIKILVNKKEINLDFSKKYDKKCQYKRLLVLCL